MSIVASKVQITSAVDTIENITNSYVSDEALINIHLDAILSVRNRIQVQNTDLSALIASAEALTWYEMPDSECLGMMQQLIARMHGLKDKYIRFYAGLADFRSQGIASEEIRQLCMLIDDLGETANDLYSVFFTLPADSEFQALNNRLRAL